MREKKEYNKICIVCGEPFVANSASAKMCGKKCIHIRARQLSKEKYDAEKAKVYEYNHMESMSLAQMNAAAREHGMTYGKYVGWLECEKRRKEREERKRRNDWD